jgi:hypothetical protein
MIEVHRIDAEESELRESEPNRERLLTIALLIFSLGYCALVFSAGWKEASAYDRCGLDGALKDGHSCQAAAPNTLWHYPIKARSDATAR